MKQVYSIGELLFTAHARNRAAVCGNQRKIILLKGLLDAWERCREGVYGIKTNSSNTWLVLIAASLLRAYCYAPSQN